VITSHVELCSPCLLNHCYIVICSQLKGIGGKNKLQLLLTSKGYFTILSFPLQIFTTKLMVWDVCVILFLYKKPEMSLKTRYFSVSRSEQSTPIKIILTEQFEQCV